MANGMSIQTEKYPIKQKKNENDKRLEHVLFDIQHNIGLVTQVV